MKSKWRDGTWLGFDDRSHEHIVVLTGGVPAIKVRTVRPKAESERWSAEEITAIVATLDAPNPKDPQQERPCAERDTRGLGSPGHKAPREAQARESAEETREGGADLPEAPTSNAEVDIRNFRINDDLLGKFGYSAGCPDCDAKRHGGERRVHTRPGVGRGSRRLSGRPIPAI